MRRLFAIALGLTIIVPLMAVMLVFAAGSSQAQCDAATPVGVGSAPGVPSELLAIYDHAAGSYRLGAQGWALAIYDHAAGSYRLGAHGWAYLAAINYVETDFGHDLSTSSAGAVGWMQIDPGTWDQYAVSADPAKPGAAPDPYDAWDAIFTAANYLHASGAPGDWPGAIYAYNHAGWYVSEVQQLAQVETNPDLGVVGAGGWCPTIRSSSTTCSPGRSPTGRLVPTELDAQLGRGPDGLMVAPTDPDRAANLDEAAYRTLFTRLGELVGTLVLDCGTGLDDRPARAALACADQLVLRLGLDFACDRGSSRRGDTRDAVAPRQ